MSAGLCALARHFRQLFPVHVQPRRDHFQKTSGARGAAVVHRKIADAPAVFERDDLAVLSADFDDGARVRRELVDAARVAGDFGDGGVGETDGVASIAGGHDAGNLRPLQSRILQQSFKKFRRQPFLFHALVGQAGGENSRTAGVEQHRLDRARTRVYAGANHVEMLKAKG